MYKWMFLGIKLIGKYKSKCVCLMYVIYMLCYVNTEWN